MLLTLVGGVFGILTGGFLVKYTGKYKYIMIGYTSGFNISVVLWGVVLIWPNIYTLTFISFLLGFFLSPCLTIGIELACEVAFPVGEAYSNGII